MIPHEVSAAPPRAASLRRTIGVSLGFAVAGVALISALAVGGIERGAWLMRRAEHSYVQSGLAQRLDVEITAYRLAETRGLFQGSLPPAEAEAARVAATLADYRARTEAEIAMIADAAEREDEAEELESVAEIARLFGELRAAFARHRAGDGGAEADAAHGAAVADLSAALRLSIGEIVADETEEAAAAQAEIAALRRSAHFAGAAAVVLALAIAATLAAGLGRAILRPLDALAAGVRDFGAGALGRRLTAPLPAEFAPVADRFNEMAAHIEAQQTALADANARLQHDVAARTAELAASNARLAAVDAARRRFLANVSHELRTPLTVLVGEAEAALRGPEDASALREACERITANGDYLRRRLDDFMRLARSEEGELGLASAPLDLAAVAAEATRFAQGYARARGVRLACADAAAAPAVGDAEALRQAALALIDNAVKNSPEGGRVDVATSADDGAARLTVADEGRGFNPARKAHIFSRYGREGAGGEGKGLGLAIAAWIVERHGGVLDAELRPTGGAVFSISLPLRAS